MRWVSCPENLAICPTQRYHPGLPEVRHDSANRSLLEAKLTLICRFLPISAGCCRGSTCVGMAAHASVFNLDTACNPHAWIRSTFYKHTSELDPRMQPTLRCDQCPQPVLFICGNIWGICTVVRLSDVQGASRNIWERLGSLLYRAPVGGARRPAGSPERGSFGISAGKWPSSFELRPTSAAASRADLAELGGALAPQHGIGASWSAASCGSWAPPSRPRWRRAEAASGRPRRRNLRASRSPQRQHDNPGDGALAARPSCGHGHGRRCRCCYDAGRPRSAGPLAAAQQALWLAEVVAQGGRGPWAHLARDSAASAGGLSG